jgi:hypothetical protein
MTTHHIVRASAWIVSLMLALPLCAQDQPATPPVDAAAPAEAPASFAEQTAEQAAAALDAATDATPAAEGASIVGTPEGTEVAETAEAAAGEPPADTRALDETVQDLKKDVVDLNRELFVLEEELLFPANTQVAVFVSMDIGEFFALDSLTLKIDNKEVANYLYTPREAEALLKGGVHRVFLGNLKVGEHQLVAFFNGKGPMERDYKRGANLTFEKGVGAKYLELKITDRQRRGQPEFAIKDWE